MAAKADMPMAIKTTNDFKLPAPKRISDLLAQPEPITMPEPNNKPPNSRDNQGSCALA